MSDRTERFARAITAFVENPVTNLVKGILLFLIGLSEASRTLVDDLRHQHLRAGHGLVIIGLFGILQALPHLIDGLGAGQAYLDLRAGKAHPEPGPGAGPDRGENRVP